MLDHSNTMNTAAANVEEIGPAKPRTIKFTGRIRQSLTQALGIGMAAKQADAVNPDLSARDRNRLVKDVAEMGHALAWLNQRIDRMDGPNEDAAV